MMSCGTFSETKFLNMVKAPLQESGVIGSDELKLEVFRAGDAWQMVRDGILLLELMAALEWRTSAFACCIPMENRDKKTTPSAKKQL